LTVVLAIPRQIRSLVAVSNMKITKVAR
jgi:hypothetical protein